jgi:hypothetical protein
VPSGQAGAVSARPLANTVTEEDPNETVQLHCRSCYDVNELQAEGYSVQINGSLASGPRSLGTIYVDDCAPMLTSSLPIDRNGRSGAVMQVLNWRPAGSQRCCRFLFLAWYRNPW